MVSYTGIENPASGPSLLLLAHGRCVLIAAYPVEGWRCYAAGDAHFPADLHPLGLLSWASAQRHRQLEHPLAHAISFFLVVMRVLLRCIHVCRQ